MLKKRKQISKRTTLCGALAAVLLVCGGVGLAANSQSVQESTLTQTTSNQNDAGASEIVKAQSETVNVDNTFTFTTFNVGNFARGIKDGIQTSDAPNPNNPYEGIDAWKTVFDFDNNYENHKFQSDFYFFQECGELVWEYNNSETDGESYGTKLSRDDVFTNIFENVYAHKGDFSYATNSESNPQGATHAWLVMASNKLQVRDITWGGLSGKNELNRRGYVKGYIDVNGEEVAIYNVHLGWQDAHGAAVEDSYYELIKMMNEDKYVIVAGDMNGSTIAEYMIAAGYQAANRGDKGDFSTSIHNNTSYIDNIFVSPNITINSVKVDTDCVGYSDHYPLTASLTINAGTAGVTPTKPTVGADGFTTDYK